MGSRRADSPCFIHPPHRKEAVMSQWNLSLLLFCLASSLIVTTFATNQEPLTFEEPAGTMEGRNMKRSINYEFPPNGVEYGKRNPYEFGIGKRSPYEFGVGKRSPYEFGIDKRSPYEFGVGKRNPYKLGGIVLDKVQTPTHELGVGKRSPYEFGIGKRSPYEFGIGKRSPYGFGVGK